MIWFWIIMAVAVAMIIPGVLLSIPPSEAQVIARKKQRDTEAIDAAYKETIVKMNNAAGQPWRNIGR